MFISKVKIFVKAGNGGKGAISFRREKFVPFGGPDGGNGGNGGNIIFITDEGINTLSYFKYHKHFFAENGKNGKSSNCYGKNGIDLIIKVPVGTSIFKKNGELIGVLEKKKASLLLFTGGKGGIGNGKLSNSIEKAPKYSIPPEIKEMEEIILILTLKTDVGILGLPNSGKSSLINCLSRANSIVDDYAFTTISPILGQMYDTNISLMDLPGIIEGAAEGKGKGIEFLKHSEQCKIFLKVIDITEKPLESYKIINDEITKYGNKLINKNFLLIFNKIDIFPFSLNIKKIFKNDLSLIPEKENIFFISAKNNLGIEELKKRIIKLVEEEKMKTDNQIFISFPEDSDEDLWKFYYEEIYQNIHKILYYFNEKRTISILLTTTESMIYFNKINRNEEKDTNVLSLELENNEYCLGEIILSYHKILLEYNFYFKSFQNYIFYLCIHGILHLLGYNHENEEEAKKMEDLEYTLLKYLGVNE